jgi:hypothetical protein
MRKRCAGHVARKGEKDNAHRVLVGTPGWQGTLGSMRRWCKKDANTYVKELGRDSVVWIYLTKNVEKLWVLVTTVTNIGVPFTGSCDNGY